jgi:hypothetical protein
MVVEGPGRVALAGFTLSDNFPVTSNAVQTVNRGNGDGFLTILDTNTANQLAYSTFYGGSDGDVFYELRRGPTGYYYMGGYTLSRDLKTVDALKPASALGATDGLVVIIDPNETLSRALIYASYVTGPGFQFVQNLEVDNAGNVYVVGQSLGNVFDPGQAAPPADSSTNVFMFVFRPSPPAVVRQDPETGSRESRSRR